MVDVPSVCEVIEMRVDGRLVQPQQPSSGRLTIPLARGRLARRFEMLFFTHRDPDSNDHRLGLPTPRELSIEQTLWTLRSPSTHIRPVVPKLQAATLATQNLRRLAAIDQLTRIPAGNMAQLTQEEQSRWYHAWHDRYQQARNQLAAAPSDVPPSDILPKDTNQLSLEAWDQCKRR